jgi:serine/threonine protein kinase
MSIPNRRARLCFANRVRVFHSLQEHIVHFETYQGFCLGGQFQLFFRLYEGSLATLIPPHKYDANPPVGNNPPQYWDTLVKQMVLALEYLHAKDMVHMDIKPGNIMHAKKTPDSPGQRDFFLGDFGLSKTKAQLDNTLLVAGTPPYQAPEIGARGAPTTASDIRSLGVTLCEVRGYLHPGEWYKDRNYWMKKFARLGYTAYDYAEPKDEQKRWEHRVLTFAQHCEIPVILARMLRKQEEERPTAPELVRTPIAEFDRVPNRSAAERKAAMADSDLDSDLDSDSDSDSDATGSSESASEEQ